MERELKFRAWDKELKLMASSPNFYIDNGKPLIYGDYILMQYTGLKDQGGNEIFEGDILKQYDKLFSVIVEYTPPSFVLRVNRIELRNRTYTLKEHNIFDIIGNIFETPELLKS